MAYNNCFHINTKSAYNAVVISPSSHLFSNLSARPILPPVDASIETVLENGIKVYGNANIVKQISDLVAKYPLI